VSLSLAHAANRAQTMFDVNISEKWLLHTERGNACRAAKCDAIANKLTAPNVHSLVTASHFAAQRFRIQYAGANRWYAVS